MDFWQLKMTEVTSSVTCLDCPFIVCKCGPRSFCCPLQAIPYCWTLLYVPMHFLTHELLLFATGIWTTNIHDCIHGRLDPQSQPPVHCCMAEKLHEAQHLRESCVIQRTFCGPCHHAKAMQACKSLSRAVHKLIYYCILLGVDILIESQSVCM